MAKDKDAKAAAAEGEQAPLFTKKGLLIVGGGFLGWTVVLVVVLMFLLGGEDKDKDGGSMGGSGASAEGAFVGQFISVPQVDVGYKSQKDTNPYLSVQFEMEIDPGVFPDKDAEDFKEFVKMVENDMPVITEIVYDAIMVKERAELFGIEGKNALKAVLQQKINEELERTGHPRPIRKLNFTRYQFSE